MTPSTIAAAVALSLALAAPLLGTYRHRRRDAERVDWPEICRGIARYVVVLVVAVALVATAGSPADVGLRFDSTGAIVDGFAYGFIAFGAVMLVVSLLQRYRGADTADPASLVVFDQSPSRRLVAGVAGATVESVLFYGVALEAVLALGGPPVVAGAVGAGGLLLARLRWGHRQALQWAPGAVVLSTIALWAGTVVPVLLVRLLYDTLTYATGTRADYVADVG